MRAIYLKAPQELSVSQVPEPTREGNHVLIKVHSMGICGSDVGAYKGVNPLVKYPLIIGHEIAGEVLEVPEGETGLKAGDHVVIEPYVYCGKCYPCSHDRTNCCENLTVRGVHINGGMSEFTTHPRHLVHKVPKDTPWELLAMVEPLTISVHAVRRAKVQKGEHVVINGCGAIGLLAAQFALILGAIPIVLDPVDERLAFAKKLGVKYAVNPVSSNAVEEIKEITGGRMAEAVIEASGSAAAVRGSIDYAAYSGRISLVGWPKSEISLPTALFTKKELDVVGSRNSFHAFDESIMLVSEGKIDVRSLITRLIDANDVPLILKDIAEHPENYLKVVALF